MIKIAVMGCSGRMGRIITKQVLDTEGCTFIGGTVKPDSLSLGIDIGELIGNGPLGLYAVGDPEPLIENADVVIDFTVPQASVRHVVLAKEHRVPIVIGTTGLAKDEREEIITASNLIPVVFTPNMSIGVNLLLKFVEDAAKRLDEEFDIEIFEMHHRFKSDAPSGTAIALGQAAAKGRGVNLQERGISCRTGQRLPGEIGFAVARGGNVTGDHDVMFASDFEIIEFSHRALNPGVFASGAVRAAMWLLDKPNGLYTMKNVLDI